MNHVNQELTARPVFPVDECHLLAVEKLDFFKNMADSTHILHSLFAADSQSRINIGCDKFRRKCSDRHHQDQVQRTADNRVKDLIVAEDVIISDPKLLLQADVFLYKRTDVLQGHLLNPFARQKRSCLFGLHGTSCNPFYSRFHIFFHRHLLFRRCTFLYAITNHAALFLIKPEL